MTKHLDTATHNHIKILKDEIEILESKINKNIGGQGHIHTTINTLKHRIKEMSQMGSYLVTWKIDIQADDAYSAAKEALEIMQDKESCALCFDVKRLSTGDVTIIDLETGEEVSE